MESCAGIGTLVSGYDKLLLLLYTHLIADRRNERATGSLLLDRHGRCLPCPVERGGERQCGHDEMQCNATNALIPLRPSDPTSATRSDHLEYEYSTGAVRPSLTTALPCPSSPTMPPTPTSSTGNGGQHATNHSMSITYTSTSSFLDSPLCSHFVSALSNQFPLRNVPHRSASPSASSSTIQSLPTRLIPLADELLKAKHKPETRHLLQANLLERPFAHVFLVATADSDFYRTQVRNEIRNWLTTIKDTPTLHAYSATDDTADTTSSPDTNSQDDTPEYLIVYITPPSGYNTLPSAQGYFAQGPQGSRPGTPSTNSPAANSPAANDEQPVSTPKTGINKFLSGASSKSSATKDPTGGVLDKLKTDFGGKQSDRIVHISRLPAPTATSGSVSLSASHVTDPTIFTPLTTAFKTSLAHTLEMAIKSQRAQANKLKALRSVTGWNPVNVFGKLECLGNTFESVGLYEEAIQCFDDLDALYKDCLRGE